MKRYIVAVVTLPWLLVRLAYLEVRAWRLKRKLDAELRRVGMYVELVCLGPQGWESQHLTDTWGVCYRCGNLVVPTISNSASERRKKTLDTD